MSEIKFDTKDLQPCGENVSATLVDGKLIVVLDTTKNIGPSSTGKMIGVGSTSGFAAFPGGLKGNIYLGRKA